MRSRLELLIYQLFDSKRNFAEKAGLPPETVSRIIKNKSLSMETINKIVNVVPDLNLNWLISGKGEMFLKQPEMKLNDPEVIYKNSKDELIAHLKMDCKHLRQQVEFLQDLVRRLQEGEITSRKQK